MTDDQSPKRKTLGLKPTRTDSAQAAPRKAGATRPVRISDLNCQRVRDVAEGIKRARAAQDAAKPRKPADAAAGRRRAAPPLRRCATEARGRCTPAPLQR